MRLSEARRPVLAGSTLLLVLLGASRATPSEPLRSSLVAVAVAGSAAGSNPGPSIDGGSPLALTLPPPIGALAGLASGPHVVIQSAADSRAAGTPSALAAFDQIPGRVFVAYERAARTSSKTEAGCHLPWQLLAGIGKIESNHARGGKVTDSGETIGRILGPLLDGSQPGIAAIPDTDHGVWDGNKVWDRAVGPMQFIPSSWRATGRDSDGKDAPDPNNVDDATLTAAAYLCAHGRDLSKLPMLRQAVLAYNHSADYVEAVLAWMNLYAHRVVIVADAANATEVKAAVTIARTAPPPPAIPIPPTVFPTAHPAPRPSMTGPSPSVSGASPTGTSPPGSPGGSTPSTGSSGSPSATASDPSACPTPTDSAGSPAPVDATSSSDPSSTPPATPGDCPTANPSPTGSDSTPPPSPTPAPTP